MKKYFAITCIVLSASSVFFFAQAQVDEDPLTAAEKAAFEKYRTAVRNIVAAPIDAEYARIIAENKAKPLNDPTRLTEAELSKIRVSMETAKKATQILVNNEFGEMCVSIENGVAQCKIDGNMKETMKNIAIMQAQAAALKGEKGVEEITKITQSFLTRSIAASKSEMFQATLAAASAEVRGGQAKLDGVIRNADLQIKYTAWLINSPLNFFGIGQGKLAAGQAAVLAGGDVAQRLAAIAQDVKGLQSTLARLQTAIAAGKLSAEQIARLQATGEEFANRLRTNGQAIIDILNSKAVKAAIAGDAAAARGLQNMITQAEQSLGMIDNALEQLHSEAAQAQLKALADAFKTPADISRPLYEQLPQFQKPKSPTGGATTNPVKLEAPEVPVRADPAPAPVRPPAPIRALVGNTITFIDANNPQYRYAGRSVYDRATGQTIPVFELQR